MGNISYNVIGAPRLPAAGPQNSRINSTVNAFDRIPPRAEPLGGAMNELARNHRGKRQAVVKAEVTVANVANGNEDND
ncbi:hypothetical protein FRC11_001592, partial [Ceratobasidium sp. 423]